MANSSIMDSFFQRSIDDLIKGIRLHSPESSTPLSSFLSKAIEEIRREIKSTDPQMKSTALLKLTYLHSIYGFEISWAAFHVVEVISYPQFNFKRIGYLAASATFNESTEVLLLVTNQFRKDLSSSNDFEVSLALQCLSIIGTPDLCRDLCNDLFTLLSSTRPYVKKKAIAVFLRVFNKYPDAVRVCFKRLVDNLESTDPQAVSAAVGVFCELSLRDTKTYLPLAPEFYRILLDCKNNWVLIKVLKMFAKLALLEPRLGKKIVGPICEIMQRSMAKSLVFECIRTVVSSLSDHESAVKLASVKIKEFLSEDDPNLKYLGLQALSDLATKHLWAVLENKDVVLKSLSDVDSNIKLTSLRLLMSMVSEDNVAEITKVLVNYALKSDPEFCNEILRSILVTCSGNYYEIVFDFDWYVSLLGEMARVPHCQSGEEIENQLVDIGMRVKDARPELVKVGRDLLVDPALLGNPFLHGILSAAAWVSGEYVEFSSNPYELMEALLQPRTSLLPSLVRSVYIQSTFKVLVFCLQSYLWQQDVVDASSVADDMASLSFESKSGLKCLDSQDKSTHEAVANSKQMMPESAVEESYSWSFGDYGIEGAVQEKPTLSLPERKTSSQDAVVKLLNMTETALGPLLWSDEVEIQERARNILGVVHLVKEDVLHCSGHHVDKSGKKDFEVSEIANLFDDLFVEELGPISVTAQARIPVPDDLTLKDNLTDLDLIYSDIQLNPPSTFSLGTSRSSEKDDYFHSNDQGAEDVDSSTISGSLLAQHRKRHGLYYLSSEKDDTGSNDYPPAIESKNLDKNGNEVNDLVKLTDQSLKLKKKPSHAKPRPVVVKLDEGENFIPTKKLEITEDLLSGAIRDVLLGSEEVSTSSKYSEADKQLVERKGKETLVIDGHPNLREQSVAVTSVVGNSSSGRSKHKNHSKERRHHSQGESEGKERSQKEKKKSSRHRHSRHKEVEKQGSSNNGSIQTQQIPDYLL
ncbi:AP-3 complex subunit delta-like [Chenopodium quinoa]|uniref:AP-3 complex subunit delta-like n=1 Tax=Chenopodium quinoa TaxID=63459 RepID=UPI000B7806F2|nr:AP-3 complex subunit delta-like [Chenopodium quinoa]